MTRKTRPPGLGQPRPTGFVAECRCGAITGALDAERTERKEMSRILGAWLFDGKTVRPMFLGTWTAELNPCICAKSSEAK